MSDALTMNDPTAAEPPLGKDGAPIPPAVNDGNDNDADDEDLRDDRTTAEILYSDDGDDDNEADETSDAGEYDAEQFAAQQPPADDGSERLPEPDESLPPWMGASEAASFTWLAHEAQDIQRDTEWLATTHAQIEKLKLTDPAAAEAKAQAFQQATEELRGRYQELQQNAQRFQAVAAPKYQQFVIGKMAEEIPELAQQETRKQLRDYLTEQVGFEAGLVDSNTDHRLVVLAEKARRYDEMKAGKTPKRKVIPKMKPKAKGKAKSAAKAEPQGRKKDPIRVLYGEPDERPVSPQRDRDPRVEIFYGKD